MLNTLSNDLTSQDTPYPESPDTEKQPLVVQKNKRQNQRQKRLAQALRQNLLKRKQQDNLRTQVSET